MFKMKMFQGKDYDADNIKLRKIHDMFYWLLSMMLILWKNNRVIDTHLFELHTEDSSFEGQCCSSSKEYKLTPDLRNLWDTSIWRCEMSVWEQI